MPKQFTLTNVDSGTHDTQSVIDAASTGIGRSDGDWSVYMQRLQGGLSDGVDVVWLDNGCTRLAILPTRGMGIWKGSVAGTRLEWNSPVERPVHPAFVDQMRRGGIGWLDGFNELICRCGLGWHGAPGTDIIKDSDGNVVSEQFLPLHGRIANLAAHEVRVEVSDDGAISVIGVIDEASLFGGKLRLTTTLTTYIGSNTFEISDTVQNLSSAAAEVEMLYHCNFGPPLLGEGATLHIAAKEVAPRDDHAAKDLDTWSTYLGPTVGYAEQCYFVKPIGDLNGRAIAVLRSPDETKAVALRFDTATLPWFTLWKNTQAEEDGYCTGLEPGTSFPNLRSFEREHGRVVSLASQKSITFDFAVSVATNAEDAAAYVRDVDELQAGHSCRIQDKANPAWTA
ncbi:MAG: aldose 1-epimerase family protein [Planctomycetaceae bacterium]